MIVLRVAEGLDRPEGGQGPQGRRLLALAPGADFRRAREPRKPEAARELAPELQAAGAVRRQRPPDRGAARARAHGRAPHERQPARQRRTAAQGPQASRLPAVRRERARPPAPSVTRTPSRWASSCATSCATTCTPLPRVRPGRNRIQSPAGGLRSVEEDLDGATCCRRTPTAASWRATGA